MTATSLEVMFDALAGASIAGAVVALGVWALSAAVGRLPAAVRCTLWWLVSLKLLLGLTSIEPVAVPILPPAMAVTSALQCAGGGDARRDAIRREPRSSGTLTLARGADRHLAGRAGSGRGAGHWPVAPHFVDSRTRARGRCRPGELGARVV